MCTCSEWAELNACVHAIAAMVQEETVAEPMPDEDLE